MNKGHVILAQNSTTDYLRQAYALALSIKKFNVINKVCLITNDPVPLEYISVFDHVVPIPWGDMASESSWKIENRWKIIYVTPFKESLVYDSDMILLNSNDHYWYHLEDYDIALTETVLDYKGNRITKENNPYRKTFQSNDLPDVYFGLHYFKKSNKSFEFYKWVEYIIKDWKYFSDTYLKVNKQKTPSLDVAASLALTFGDFNVKNNLLSFVHMKPLIQGWISNPETWVDHIVYNFNKDSVLTVGNHIQNGLFHYTEDAFLTDDIIEILKHE
jgi:hypothetical protein